MVTDEISEGAQKSVRLYRSQPPLLAFPSYIDLMTKVYTVAGIEGNRNVIAELGGVSSLSSYFLNIIRSGKRIGFLTYNETNYQFTTLGHEAINTEAPENQRKALKILFCNLEPLNYLWKILSHKRLPPFGEVSRLIQERYNYDSITAERWSDYFFKAAVFIGVLERKNGEWYTVEHTTSDSTTKTIEYYESLPIEPFDNNIQVQNSTDYNESINIESIVGEKVQPIFEAILRKLVGEIVHKKNLSNGQQVMVIYPTNISDSDADLIKGFLYAIGRRVGGVE